MKLTIGHFYPDLFNLYGDRGNLCCLKQRLLWRGIDADILPLPSDRPVDFSRLDLLVMGGGSDREQELAGRRLPALCSAFKTWVEDGGVLLAVCGGFQLLGHTCQTPDRVLETLGVLDIHTRWADNRLVGNTVLDSPLFSSPVTGFENHAGRTDIGSYAPLGSVRSGCGNTGDSGPEGLVYKNVVATYLHGPLLPKNPQVCDYLLERALERKYQKSIRLKPLSDQWEQQANAYIVKRFAGRRLLRRL